MIDTNHIKQLIQQDDEKALRETLASLLNDDHDVISWNMCAAEAMLMKRDGCLLALMDWMPTFLTNKDGGERFLYLWHKSLLMKVSSVDMLEVVVNWMECHENSFSLNQDNVRHIVETSHPCVLKHYAPQMNNDMPLMTRAMNAVAWRRDKQAFEAYKALYPIMNEDMHVLLLGHFLEFHDHTNEHKQMIDCSYTMERMHHLLEHHGRRGYLEPSNYLVQRLLADEAKLAISKEVDQTAAGHKVRKI